MAVLWCSAMLLFMFLGTAQAARTVYNFETSSHLTAFTVPASSSLARSTTRYKDGSYSMKWTWASGNAITHSFTSKVITGRELSRGGIKLWLYNTNKRTDNLTVSFQDTLTTPGTPVTISRFQISLHFKGWRGIWVSYSESKVGTLDDIDTLKITAPTTSLTTHPLYIDLLRLVADLRSQSRDKIVPTIGAGLYTPNNFWQQTYRWSQATPTAVSSSDPNQEKLQDLSLIEKRLDNWFVNQSQSSTEFSGNVKKRWDSLQGDINAAMTDFGTLNIVKSSTGVITGVPLYARNSEYSNKEFGYVMKDVLLPMALDYHIRSRTIEVDAVAAKELSNLNNVATKAASIARIAGSDTSLQMVFTTALGISTPYTKDKVKEAMNTLNNKRKDRLMLLLEYIEDQGFTDGSGIGSLDHEMNRDGAGFMNSVYLLRKELKDAGKLPAYIATMKWYNDFGEIYQDPFEYAGTTADRMRTISLYRLLAVLMMPTTTTQEKKEKLRDIEALGRWYANALSINEALAGVLKPDFLGFHHNGYYASAYTPHALHVAALIKYLLTDTAFVLGQETSENIQNGLEVMRIISVKYSSPNSVGGRFPGFSRAILANAVPAYAYNAVDAPVLAEEGSFGEITRIDAAKVKMFLRLYDTTESAVNEYLEDGNIFTGIYYLNSIGSINILEEINRKAGIKNITAETSPRGFWAKNYASLVIQRREDWAVTVKGFNKFVWDFEASGRQNIYGLYQSHGALLVANSENSLQSYDIDNGWDWTRHPGTTTIKMNLDQLVSENRRYFQPKELAGGLVMIGGGDYSSGIFGMEFSNPPYRYPSGSFQLNIDFSFKKSVVFADYVIICLGSSITTTNSSPNITQTTLFQDKNVNPSSPSSIHINSTSHSLSTDLTKQPSFFEPADNSATLMDTNGNGYYIPNAATQGLNIKVSLQTSKKQNGRGGDTSARYATAWLDHGVNPTNKAYEYTIVVNKAINYVQTLAVRQASADNKVYEVLHKDNKAHAVKVNDCPRAGETQYAYVFFDKSVRTPGPVRRVNKAPCIVMVEEVDINNLYIAVSSPNLNLNISRTLQLGSEANGDERFYSFSQEVEVQVFVRNAVNLVTGDVKQNGKRITSADKSAHVEVKPKSVGASQGRVIKFKKLAKGFSTEVKLTR